MACAPAFGCYALTVCAVVLVLIFRVSPSHGDSNVLVYVSICSLMGSIGVMAVTALGIAIKLTVLGDNQFSKWETYVFAVTLVICTVTQMNYLTKALDTYNTAIVSSIYYVFFTVLTIAASVIMYQDWLHQTANQISSQLLGFVLIVLGVYVLHVTKDAQPGCEDGLARIMGAARPDGGPRAKRSPSYARVHTAEDAEPRPLRRADDA